MCNRCRPQMFPSRTYAGCTKLTNCLVPLGILILSHFGIIKVETYGKFGKMKMLASFGFRLLFEFLYPSSGGAAGAAGTGY